MKILHLSVHMGGGLGTVLMGWMDKVIAANDHSHEIACLDTINDKAMKWADENGFPISYNSPENLWALRNYIAEADIVLCHYYDHPLLARLFAEALPDCRLIFWCHKRAEYSPAEIAYPDIWIDTSPIQRNSEKVIWSCGNISRFLAIKPKAHGGFNIGYVGVVDYKKMHIHTFEMCREIKKHIPEATFTFVGEGGIGIEGNGFSFVGKVDYVAPYLATFDVFGYPLRPDHTGTAEQVLGEALAAGIPCVVMDNPTEREIISHLKTGLIAKNEEEYVGWIEALYKWGKQPPLFSIPNAARNYAKERYNIYTMIDQWNMVFDELMQKHKSHHGGLKRG